MLNLAKKLNSVEKLSRDRKKCIFSLMSTTVFYITALRKYLKFGLMPPFVVLSRDYPPDVTL